MSMFCLLPQDWLRLPLDCVVHGQFRCSHCQHLVFYFSVMRNNLLRSRRHRFEKKMLGKWWEVKAEHSSKGKQIKSSGPTLQTQ